MSRFEKPNTLYFADQTNSLQLKIENNGDIQYKNDNSNPKYAKIFGKYILNSNTTEKREDYLKFEKFNGETREVFDTDKFLDDFNNLKENSNRIEYEILNSKYDIKDKFIKIRFYNNNNIKILTLETDYL